MAKDVKLTEKIKTVDINQNAKWENIHSRTQKEKVQEKKTWNNSNQLREDFIKKEKHSETKELSSLNKKVKLLDKTMKFEGFSCFRYQKIRISLDVLKHTMVRL